MSQDKYLSEKYDNSTGLVSFKNSCVSAKKSIKLCHLNVENLRSHRESFINVVYDGVFDVIGLSETFLKPAVSSEPFMLSEYNLIRHDREGKEGGGVALYIKKKFKYNVVAKSDNVYRKKPEFLIVEVSLGYKFLLCLMYKPPKAGYLSDFFDIVGNLIPLYSDIVIMGDLNIDLSSNRVFVEKTMFINSVSNLNLTVLPLKPTYHLPNSDTLLDLIIVNNVNRIKKFGQFATSGISYHDLIYLELNVKERINIDKEVVTIRDFKNVNIDSLKIECSRMDWQDVYSQQAIDDKVEVLNNTLLCLYDKYVVVKSVFKAKNPCPWINNEIKLLMKERETLYKKYVRFKDPTVWERYKTMRNRIKTLLRDKRNRYFNDLLDDVQPSKNMWNILRQQGVGKESKKDVHINVNIDDLNNYFCGIQNNINNNLIGFYNNQCNYENNMFCFTEVDGEIVLKMLNSISSNAVGPDNIHIRFLKLIYHEIKDVLCHIFNYSLLNSVYPSQWKNAVILPLPKVSNPSMCSQYRPINILCVLGKILDKLAFHQIKQYIDDNNILYKYQSGYRSFYSTQTALIKVTDDIRSAIDKRQLTLVMLLDFSRAFDCVNHKLLLSILRSCNFSNNTVSWFECYLKERCQRVKMFSGQMSDWRINPIGVPQGSTLSSLLFSLYINKICSSVIFSSSMLYADDMQLYVHFEINQVNNAVNMINADLNSLFLWCKDHGLNLNIKKCKPIIFGTARCLSSLDFNAIPCVSIDGELLNYESNILNLGLKMSNNLSWSDQVDTVCKKVYRSLYQLKHLCFKPSLEIRKKLVSTLIFPIIDYAMVAYCDINSELTGKLQKAQNSCVRYIYNLRLFEHVTPYYKELKWLKIKERLELGILSLMFKVLKYGKPDYLYERYIRMRDVHLRETRFGHEVLQVPIHRTLTYSMSYHVYSIRLLNQLDRQIKESPSEHVFSKKLKELLLSRY